MRNIIFLILIGIMCLSNVSSLAQAPEKFNYQAVIRDNAGELISESIGIKLSILDETSTGTVLYSEIHTVSTNAYGQIAIDVGVGAVVSGIFSDIDWALGEKYLKVEIDVTGGDSYSALGAVQLLSVPYALYAKNVKNKDDADANPSNEIQDLNLTDNVLTITNNATATPINLASYQGTNTDEQTLDLSGTSLSITGGNTIDVSSLQDADADPANEIQVLSISNDTIYLENGGFVKLPIDNINDADNSPTNEFQTLLLDGDTLEITNGNSIVFPYDSVRWGLNGNRMYYNTGNVGIGTSDPNSKLEVKADASFTENDTLFAVKDKNGNIVFAVFPDGAKVYVNEGAKGTVGGFAVSGRNPAKATIEENYFKVTPDSTRVWVNEDAKGTVGGFAVSGRNPAKSTILNYFVTTADSTRIYINDTSTTKSTVGGFAVSGRNPAKGFGNDYFVSTADSTRIYINEGAKGTVGGFAVSGRNPAKGITDNYMQISKDSIRMYIEEGGTKGTVGGFAVSGRNPAKGSATDYFNISGNAEVDTVNSEARIFWYPKKEAFLTGRVLIESPDSVGTNSMATGYESKAVGDYSQALGYQSIARGNYSTAIGNSAMSTGESSFAFGEGVIASGKNSFAFGSFGRDEAGDLTNVKTEASGDYSVAFGLGSLALNTGSYAFGASDTSSGKWSFALGGKSHASGDYSIAMGYKAKALNSIATAIGNGANATGNFSSAIGGWAKAEGTYAISVGNSLAKGYQSIAIGYLAKSEDLNSLSFGNNTSATAPYAMALGNNTIASGNYATALTTNSKASGLASVAIGHLSEARGDYSLAVGYFTETPGHYSSATGMGTISQQLGSFVTGRYNIAKGDSLTYDESYPMFIVGNGIEETTRSNALEIYQDGTSRFWGEIMILGDGNITSHQPELTLSEAGFGFPSSYWKEWTFKGEGKKMNIYETNSSSSDVRMTFADGGNIGIGTVNPVQKLEVAGNIRLSGADRTIEVSDGYFSINPHDGTYGLILRDYTGNSIIWSSFKTIDAATDYLHISMGSISTSEGIVISDNGNVGIGATTPAYKLDVNGEITSRSQNAFRMRNSTYSAFWRNDNNDVFLMLTNSGDPDGGWNNYRPFTVDLANGNTSLSKAIYVKHEGDVSIGTTTFKAQLYVEDDLPNIGAIRAESKYSGTSNHYAGAFEANTGTKGTGVFAAGSLVDFYAGGPGGNYGPFTGAHEVVLINNFPKNNSYGLIVSSTGKVKKRINEDGSVSLSSTMPEIKLSDKVNDKAVFGVFITESDLNNKHWVKTEGRYGMVNALGEGRVYVTDANGNIEVGDYITTSIIPGYGQKQDDDLLHNYTLGKATETINWDAVTTTIEFEGKKYKVYLLAVVYTSG